MSLPQSPPTTSGIVILSGSNFFDPESSDFPVIRGNVTAPDKGMSLKGTGGQDITDLFLSSASGGFSGKIASPAKIQLSLKGAVLDPADAIYIVGKITPPQKATQGLSLAGFIPDIGEDVGITSTEVTTSGIVIMEMFPGAGESFVPPVVVNARTFPNFQGTFPEQDSRVYPRLPQFSVVTPGD